MKYYFMWPVEFEFEIKRMKSASLLIGVVGDQVGAVAKSSLAKSTP